MLILFGIILLVIAATIIISYATIFAGIILSLIAVALILSYISGCRPIHGNHKLMNSKAKVVHWTGCSGIVRVNSENWSAESSNTLELAKGSLVKIIGINDLVLTVAQFEYQNKQELAVTTFSFNTDNVNL